MKFFLKTKKYSCEVMPRARITWATIIDDNDRVTRRMLIVRTPIRQWRKYIDPWLFQHDSGWCTYTFAIRFGGGVKFMSHWEPINTSDWV